MTWLLLENSKYRHALKEIDKQRDRGAGIIAVAILEEHLVAAIKMRLEKNEDIHRKLFTGYGPLSSLSAKIDLGFLLGIYPSRFHKMLHDIREVRNDFAHNPLPVSFRSQRERCERLSFQSGAKRRWNKHLAAILERTDIKMNFFQYSKNPRVQFIGAVKVLTGFMALQTMFGYEENWTKLPDRAPQPTLALPLASLDKSDKQQPPHSQNGDQRQKKRARQPQS